MTSNDGVGQGGTLKEVRKKIHVKCTIFQLRLEDRTPILGGVIFAPGLPEQRPKRRRISRP